MSYLPYGVLDDLRGRLTRLEADLVASEEIGETPDDGPIKRVRQALKEAERMALTQSYSGTAREWLDKELRVIEQCGWGAAP